MLESPVLRELWHEWTTEARQKHSSKVVRKAVRRACEKADKKAR